LKPDGLFGTPMDRRQFLRTTGRGLATSVASSLVGCRTVPEASDRPTGVIDTHKISALDAGRLAHAEAVP
jgi:hypothetical protein